MQINAKIGKIRTAQSWTVYPPQKDGRIIIQSSHYIAVFNRNGEGLLSKRQPNGAYFVHLSPLCGAEPVRVDTTTVEAALAVQPQPGDVVMGGMVRIA